MKLIISKEFKENSLNNINCNNNSFNSNKIIKLTKLNIPNTLLTQILLNYRI